MPGTCGEPERHLHIDRGLAAAQQYLMTTDANDIVTQEVERALAVHDVTVSGTVTVRQVGDSAYEVAVPFEGELLFEDVSGPRDLLLAAERGRRISMIGVRDGKLLILLELTWI